MAGKSNLGNDECCEIMCDRCKGWEIFSEEFAGFSFRMARKKEYICRVCKAVEGERKERLRLEHSLNEALVRLENDRKERIESAKMIEDILGRFEIEREAKQKAEEEIRQVKAELEKTKMILSNVRRQASCRPKNGAGGDSIDRAPTENVRLEQRGYEKHKEWKVVRSEKKGRLCSIGKTDEIRTSNRFAIISDVSEPRNLGEVAVFGDSQMRGMGDSLNTRSGNRRVVSCYPGVGIKFLTEKVEEIREKKKVIVLHGGGNDVKGKDGKFCRSEVLLARFREALDKAKRKSEKVLLCGIIPRMSEGMEWFSRAISLNERLSKECQEQNCMFLNVWDDFIDKPECFNRDRVHLSLKGRKMLARLINDRLQGN